MSHKLTCFAAVCLAIALAGSAGAQELGAGKVLFEYWFGGGINNNVDTLKADADFPDNPEQSEWRDGMDRPDLSGVDYFGARGRAFLTPPETGDYTFWTASDDDSELWLSTDADPANAVMIANVEGWCNYQNWTGSGQAPGPNRQSAPVPLIAGQKYYMELVFSDGTGGGHASVAWAGPGVGDTPTVLKGDVLTALIRDPEPLLLAQNPKPANGALDVTSPLLEWTAGITAAAHDLYFGTSEVLGPNDFMGTQPIAMYFHIAGFEPGVTYYWRVDEVDAAGVTYEGNTWSFTTLPLTAHLPSPYDGALWRKTDLTVSWVAGQDAVSHMVYGGTDEAAVAAGDPSVLLATVAEPMLDASALLEPATTYFWRVDEVDSAGAVHEGEVWTFSTFDPAGGALAEYWDNMTLAGEPKVVTIVPEINFDWGDGASQGVNSPDPCIPTNNFSCRWTAALNVPVTGTYKLYDASDDGGRLFLNGEQITNGWVDRGTTEDASADLELVAGERYVLVMEMYENGGGATAYLRWSGPGIPKEIIPQGALQLVTWATSPQPVSGAEGLGDRPMLSWVAGIDAVEHDIFLSTDQALVAAGDAKAYIGRQAETSYVPAALKWNTTYYWRVDEVAEDGSLVAGDVWSFKVADYIPIFDGPLTLTYDNTVEPYVTELITELPAPQDWTKNGVTSVQLEILGGAPKFSVADGVFTLTGAGADVYMGTEEFRFLYKQLEGDGSIAVKVDDVATINDWTKAGIMVRESLDQFAMSVDIISAAQQSLIEWMHRDVTGSTTTAAIATAGGSSPLPVWLRITRAGDVFTSEYSLDGATWTAVTAADGATSSITLVMPSTVYIGMLVCSHVANTSTSAQFSGVETTGNVGGDWAAADIGVAQGGNDPAPIYVAVTDADGKMAVVTHPDNPNVVLSGDWMTWKILTSAFSGVNLKKITSFIVGVGDGQPDGAGSIQVANARVVKPIQIAVVNPSFEQPNRAASSTKLLFAPPAIRFESVPGWSTDKAPTNSSIRKNAHPTNGSWAAFLWGGEPAIWQVTDHVIIEGEAFQLDLDASVVLGGVRDDVDNLKISLFYDNDGKRVSIGSAMSRPKGVARGFSLSVSAANARAGVGHNLGIEIANVRDNGLGVDNIRLKTK